MNLSEFELHFKATEKIKLSKLEFRDISTLIVKCGLRKTKADVKRVMQQGGL